MNDDENPLDLAELTLLAQEFELSQARTEDGILSFSKRSSIVTQTIGIHTNLTPRQAEQFAYLLQSVPRLLKLTEKLERRITSTLQLFEIVPEIYCCGTIVSAGEILRGETEEQPE